MSTAKRQKPTWEQAEEGLIDPNYLTRFWWARNKQVEPTPERVDRGLRDTAWKVRLAWARREDFTPLRSQVEDGLRDVNHDVRLAWVNRRDWSVSWLSQAMIDVMRDDRSGEVVAAWIRRPDVRMTRDLLWNAQRSAHWRARMACAEREDWQASAYDIRLGMSDWNRSVRAMWAGRAASLYPGLPWERYQAIVA